IPTSSHKLLPQTPSASFHQHTASSQHEPHFTANPTTNTPCACHSNHIFIKQTKRKAICQYTLRRVLSRSLSTPNASPATLTNTHQQSSTHTGNFQEQIAQTLYWQLSPTISLEIFRIEVPALL
ncbi:hypothetical protein, partial [Bartonella sp. ML71XJBT]|uniref:hypothetical protein n=1 Tax=Bartonella sp. ML71XJBT TaxID=3019094 RepID=UPI002360634F